MSDLYDDVLSSGGDGWTALHRAAMDGNVAEVETLIGSGFNVNVRTTAARSGVKFVCTGSTPLHVAGVFGNLEVARSLLRHSAELDALDKNL